MPSKTNSSRRNFLKVAAASTAGITLLNAEKVFSKPNAWPSSGKLEINPNISNMRVVCCYDQKMIKATTTPSTWATSNSNVDSALIQANLDLMAIKLTQKETADLAWQTIFQKPASKTWAQVKVAIKINCINSTSQPRLAVVEKICRVLNKIGVAPANLVVYDGCPAGKNAGGAQTTLWSNYFSTTDAAKIPGTVSKLNDGLGGTLSTIVPGLSNHDCTKNISNGTVDILVNCAVNKGHAKYAGGTTLCMKNHFGTFAPDHGGVILNNIIGYNKSDAILGGTPPRQQLCIVDALYSDTNNNPDGNITDKTYRLVMGTFAPIVDYLTAQKIRKAIMITINKGSDNHDWAAVDKFVTSFGYSTSDAFDWQEFTPSATGLFNKNTRQDNNRSFEVSVNNNSANRAVAKFTIPQSSAIRNIEIVDLKGRIIRELKIDNFAFGNSVHWDGKNVNGRMAAAGNYVVKVMTNNSVFTNNIMVTR